MISSFKKVLKSVFLALRGMVFALARLLTFQMRKPWPKGMVPTNILVIPMERLGDNIVSIPTFRAIREGFPSARITVFASAYSKELLERIPAIDHIVTFGAHASIWQKAEQIRSLSSAGFDLVVDLTSDYTFGNVFLCWRSKARYRIGFDIAGRGFLFNQPVAYPREPISSVEILLKIPQSLGLKIDNKNLGLVLREDERKRAQAFLSQDQVGPNDLLIGIHPGGYYPTQRWPLERWAKVADWIIERYQAKIILLGNREDSQKIQNNMAHKTIIFYEDSLPGLLALMERTDLLLCNNSGPMHMACALKTPTVSTLGPTLPEKWWPQGEGHVVLRKQLPCMPCNEGFCRIKTHDCMNQILVADMMDAVGRQLKKD